MVALTVGDGFVLQPCTEFSCAYCQALIILKWLYLVIWIHTLMLTYAQCTLTTLRIHPLNGGRKS